MMEEQYISFETAKMAKEKGFDEICNSDYCKGLINYPDADNSYRNSEINKDGRISRPTQSLLARWLREKYGQNIYTVMSNNGKYIVWAQDIHSLFKFKTTDSYDIYEEALEAGLQEALKLI